MEKKGIPTVSEVFDVPDLLDIAAKTFYRAGVPECRQVKTLGDLSLRSLSEYVPELIEALTKPLTEKEKYSGIYSPKKRPRILMTGTYDEIQHAFIGDKSNFDGIDRYPVAKMTDGLPVTPPTEERVARMLEGTSHSPDEIVSRSIPLDHFYVPQLELTATVEKVAINAVMAGCLPEHMPVVLAIAELGAAVGCPCDCDFGNMNVVSGPIAEEIAMNSWFHVLSPGNPANMAIGRAATLMGINLAGADIGVYPAERLGSHIWGLTFAESPKSPWDGLNVNEGFGPDESVLVSFGGPIKLLSACLNEVKAAESLYELQNGSPEQLIAALEASKEARSAFVLMTPHTAEQWLDRYGFKTMQQLQDYLWENVTRTRGEWGKQYFFYMTSRTAAQAERGSRMLNPDHLDLPDDAVIPQIIKGPKEIKIIVTGGVGGQWGYGDAWGTASTSIDKWR
jgi:hypothetical protein